MAEGISNDQVGGNILPPYDEEDSRRSEGITTDTLGKTLIRKGTSTFITKPAPLKDAIPSSNLTSNNKYLPHASFNHGSVHDQDSSSGSELEFATLHTASVTNTALSSKLASTKIPFPSSLHPTSTRPSHRKIRTILAILLAVFALLVAGISLGVYLAVRNRSANSQAFQTRVGGSSTISVTSVPVPPNPSTAFGSGPGPLATTTSTTLSPNQTSESGTNGASSTNALSTAATTPTAPTLPVFSLYVNCFTSSSVSQILASAPANPMSKLMTVSQCLSSCAFSGFTFAGLTQSNICQCGSTAPSTSNQASTSSSCILPCAGDATSICGGLDAYSVYSTTFIGCYKDSRNHPDMSYTPDPTFATTYSIPGCISACKGAGLAFAAIRNGGSTCYCGNTYGSYGTSTDCKTPCQASESKGYICGGSNENDYFSTVSF